MPIFILCYIRTSDYQGIIPLSFSFTAKKEGRFAIVSEQTLYFQVITAFFVEFLYLLACNLNQSE